MCYASVAEKRQGLRGNGTATVLILSALLLGLPGISSVALAVDKVIRLGVSDPLSSPHGQALQLFERTLETKTNGAIDVQLFPSNQLGREVEQMEGVRAGTQEMMVATPAWFASFYPKIEVFELPFLFADWEAAAKVYNSEIFNQITADAEAATDIKIVGWFPLGFRNIYSSRRHVEKLEDLRGMKIRLQNARVHVETFRALGAIPVSMPAGDVYQAIKTGVLDAGETPTTIIALQKYSEIAPYITKTQHFFATFLIYVNKRFYEGLSADHRKAFDGAAKEAAAAGYTFAEKADQEAEGAIKAAGGKILEPSADTKDDMRAAVRSVYQEFGSKLDPYYSKVIALQPKL